MKSGYWPFIVKAKWKIPYPRSARNRKGSRIAGLMGVNVQTIQDQEQGQHKPSSPAWALLRIAEQSDES